MQITNKNITFGHSFKIASSLKKYFPNPQSLVKDIEGDIFFRMKKTKMPELLTNKKGQIYHKQIPAVKVIAKFPMTIKNIIKGKTKFIGTSMFPLSSLPSKIDEKYLFEHALKELKWNESSSKLFQ